MCRLLPWGATSPCAVKRTGCCHMVCLSWLYFKAPPFWRSAKIFSIFWNFNFLLVPKTPLRSRLTALSVLLPFPGNSRQRRVKMRRFGNYGQGKKQVLSGVEQGWTYHSGECQISGRAHGNSLCPIKCPLLRAGLPLTMPSENTITFPCYCNIFFH